jgi:predicted ATPase
MSAPRSRLQSMFDPANRHSTFGEMLIRVHLQGLRCHSNTVLEVASPITALCGMNGTGKSTLLQIAASAYNSPTPNLLRRFYPGDFLVVGALDPAPFQPGATVSFGYWQADRTTRTLTLTRRTSSKRWSGYRRQPKRQVVFAGVGLYLPRVEERGFVVTQAAKLRVVSESAMTARTSNWTSRIVNTAYTGMTAKVVDHGGKQESVATVSRHGATYSEAHMGYGEGRTQFLVDTLEKCPPQSLVLLEEPETSLHPSAQAELGRYLVDVAIERRHQILLTTHSEHLLAALPSQSLTYLRREGADISLLPGLTPLQARSLLAAGGTKALTVLVEDDVGKAITTEIIRRVNPALLETFSIHIGGDAGTISTTVRCLKESGLPVVAVRDGDQGAAPRDGLLCLPGTEPPEKELFRCTAFVQQIQQTYGLSLPDFCTSLLNVNHHEWFTRLAERLSVPREFLVVEAARLFSRTIPENEATTLVALLRESSRQ